MNPLISVIIPVYNQKDYIEKCIHSMCNQTYKNLEILLMDDGSTDGSEQICDYFSEKDKRIRVIHKENSGVADTRNTAIKLAQGEFYCFCDADDYVAPNYIEHMYSIITSYDADIAECVYLFAYDNGETMRTKNFKYPDDYVDLHSGKEALCAMLYGDMHSPGCPCKLFRSNKTHLSFPNLKIGEDLLAIAKAYNEAERVVFSNLPLYFYLQNQQSVTHTVRPDILFDAVTSAEMLFNVISDADSELKTAMHSFLVEKAIDVLGKLLSISDQDEKIEKLYRIIKKYRKSVILNPKKKSILRLNCFFSIFGKKALVLIKKLRASI